MVIKKKMKLKDKSKKAYADDDEVSALKSDEPAKSEGAFVPELENEGKREEEEDAEDKDFYGKKNK